MSLSDYEKLRAENIRRNDEHLQWLGLTDKIVPKEKPRKKKPNDDNDDDEPKAFSNVPTRRSSRKSNNIPRYYELSEKQMRDEERALNRMERNANRPQRMPKPIVRYKDIQASSRIHKKRNVIKEVHQTLPCGPVNSLGPSLGLHIASQTLRVDLNRDTSGDYATIGQKHPCRRCGRLFVLPRDGSMRKHTCIVPR